MTNEDKNKGIKLARKLIKDKSIDTIQEFLLNVKRADIVEGTSIKLTTLRRKIDNVGSFMLDQIVEISEMMEMTEDDDFAALVIFLRNASQVQKSAKRQKKSK